MMALLLACWIFCADCPPEPHFVYELLSKQELSGNRHIRYCCLDNGHQRPIYIFQFLNFYPYTKISFPTVDYFSYDVPYIQVDGNGWGVFIAIPVQGKSVPQNLDFSLHLGSFIGDEEIGLKLVGK